MEIELDLNEGSELIHTAHILLKDMKENAESDKIKELYIKTKGSKELSLIINGIENTLTLKILE